MDVAVGAEEETDALDVAATGSQVTKKRIYTYALATARSRNSTVRLGQSSTVSEMR